MAFKLSNGLNGGATTETVVPLMFIDSILSGADIVISLTAIATSITALLAASAFLPALGAAVILIASFAALIATIDHIISVQEHWENALDGDQTAIEELKWECGFNLLFTAATFGLGKGASAVANKAASKTLTKYLGEEAGTVAKATFKENLPAAARFAKRAAKQGVDDVALHLLMESSDCLKYGDDAINDLLKVYDYDQISGVYMYLDNLKIIPETMDGVWLLSATKRGIAFENYFAATKYKTDFHIGAELNGYYPVIDFINEDTMISFKTLDPRLSSYQNLIYLEDVIDSYAEALDDFRISWLMRLSSQKMKHKRQENITDMIRSMKAVLWETGR